MTHKNKTVLIIGGGFGGLATAMTLEKARPNGLNTILIDQNCFHLYHALLYEVATASVDIHEKDLIALQSGVCIRLKSLQHIALKTHIMVMQDRVLHIKTDKTEIETANGGRLKYDYLVISAGSQVNYFSIPGLAEHSVSLKELPDALRIHIQIEKLLQQNKRKRVIRIHVGGGGVAGVEVAGELGHYLLRLSKQSRIQLQRFEVHLFEAGPTLLPGFPLPVQTAAIRRLQSLGIKIHVGQPIVRVDQHELALKDTTRHQFDLFIWCGGIRGSELLKDLQVPLTPKKQIKVLPTLQVPTIKNIFVIGDNASVEDIQLHKPVPQIAPEAVNQGRHAAKNILASLEHQQLHPYQAVHPGYVFPIGGQWAISANGNRLFTGKLAWWIRKYIDLKYFLSILRFSSALKAWAQGGRAYLQND